MKNCKFVVPVLLAAVLLASVPARADTVSDRLNEVIQDLITDPAWDPNAYPDFKTGWARAALYKGQQTGKANTFIYDWYTAYTIPKDTITLLSGHRSGRGSGDLPRFEQLWESGSLFNRIYRRDGLSLVLEAQLAHGRRLSEPNDPSLEGQGQ